MNSESLTKHKYVRLGAAGLIVAGAGLSSWAIANATADEGEAAQLDGRAFDLGDMWERTDEAERDHMFDGSTAQQRAALEEMFDRASEEGLVPVAQPFGGLVSTEIMNQPHRAESRDDLFPVFDVEGNVIAYWGVGLGPVDKELVESGVPLDFDELRAQNGRSIEGQETSLSE
jgi:hypothetical protein